MKVISKIEQRFHRDEHHNLRAVHTFCGVEVPLKAAHLARLREDRSAYGGTYAKRLARSSEEEGLFVNLDGLFDWILKERATMSERLFRMELRIDILDDESYEKFRRLVLIASRQCFANAKLMNQSPVQPQIAIITNDGFIGQKDIEMFEDLLAPDTLGAVETGEEAVSSELLAAVSHHTQEKNK